MQLKKSSMYTILIVVSLTVIIAALGKTQQLLFTSQDQVWDFVRFFILWVTIFSFLLITITIFSKWGRWHSNYDFGISFLLIGFAVTLGFWFGYQARSQEFLLYFMSTHFAGGFFIAASIRFLIVSKMTIGEILPLSLAGIILGIGIHYTLEYSGINTAMAELVLVDLIVGFVIIKNKQLTVTIPG